MDLDSKIYVAGHRGLVGSAIVRNLISKGFSNLITRTHEDLNLKDSLSVATFFEQEKPEYVFLAAAKVGGIMANNIYRAEFIYDNLQIQNNVIHQSYLHGVKKLLFLGSSCVYPKSAIQPIKEEYLLTDILEYTNEPYAVAKISGMKMCEAYNLQYHTNFISVMPTNLYGPNDNFHLENSHVLPGLIRKMHLSKLLENGDFESLRKDLNWKLSDRNDEFKSDQDIIFYLQKHGILLRKSEDKTEVILKIWGSGTPLREFLWSDDMADACVYVMQNLNFTDLYNANNKEIRNTHINIGSGKEISIKDLAFLIKDLVEFKGNLVFDSTKPDGTLRKLLDTSKLANLGWTYSMELEDGIAELYRIYKEKH